MAANGGMAAVDDSVVEYLNQKFPTGEALLLRCGEAAAEVSAKRAELEAQVHRRIMALTKASAIEWPVLPTCPSAHFYLRAHPHLGPTS